jgi:hypothetical protein
MVERIEEGPHLRLGLSREVAAGQEQRQQRPRSRLKFGALDVAAHIRRQGRRFVEDDIRPITDILTIAEHAPSPPPSVRDGGHFPGLGRSRSRIP